MGVSAVDWGVLLIGTALLFVVSVLQERGVQVGEKVRTSPLVIRWPLLIAGIVCVLLMGVWGSGFNEAAFIYYQF